MLESGNSEESECKVCEASQVCEEYSARGRSWEFMFEECITCARVVWTFCGCMEALDYRDVQKSNRIKFFTMFGWIFLSKEKDKETSGEKSGNKREEKSEEPSEVESKWKSARKVNTKMKRTLDRKDEENC